MRVDMYLTTVSDCQLRCICAEHGSEQSAGPTVSLCNWLPSHSAAIKSQSAAEGRSAHDALTPHPSGHMQSRQQFQAVPPQQQQQHSAVSNQLCGDIKQPGHDTRQQPACAYKAAERKRQQCLLEIERELLRHSSSDNESPPDHMQLPNHSAGKRHKTACTGEDLCFAVSSLLATHRQACSSNAAQLCKSHCIATFVRLTMTVPRIC